MSYQGRTKELTDIQHWIIQDRCRLVAIYGRGGIGKTTLATLVADAVQGMFERVFWRSLRYALPLQRILQDCLLFVSNQKQIDLPEDGEHQISILLEYLRKYHCLLVLDNVEAIMKGGSHAGSYREGYEDYGLFFRHVGETKHQSCLLFTSREQPHEVALLEGEVLSVRSHRLIGLGPIEGRAILDNKGLHGEEQYWDILVNRYAGNPLSLKLVSQFIREVFDGDIASFLSDGDFLLSDLYELIQQQFDRLSTMEQDIIYWLALEREPVSLKELSEDMVPPVPRRILQEALQSLRRRDLIETSERGFTLQNVIMEYVTERFVNQISDEIIQGTIAHIESHALIKAQTKDYIREDQVLFLLEPVAQRLLKVLGKAGIEEKLQYLLSMQREMHTQHHGYTAGNILNLFVQLRYDLRGYDFSRLVVRQAWLQGVALPEVNFAQAHLIKCAFVETFGDVLSVAFSPNGELVAAGTTSNDLRVWRVADGMPLLVCEGHEDWVYAVAFSPDGSTIASGSYDQSIRLWDANTGQLLQVLRGYSNGVRAVAFSPDSSILASGSDDQSIRLWNVDTGQTLRMLLGHESWVRAIAFSPDGNILASCNDDQSIRLWNVSTGDPIKILQGHEHGVWSVAFSPDGKILASSGDDQSIRLWDATSGNVLRTLQGHNSGVRAVAFSSDGMMLVSSSDDQSIRIWDVNTGQTLKTLQGHESWVRAIALSPDSTIVASGSGDQSVRLWDTRTGQALRTLQGHTRSVWSIAFNPDGSIMASSSGRRSVYLWSVATKQVLKTLLGHKSTVWSIAFSPTGKILASGCDDHKVRLWDANTGRLLKTLQGHSNAVRAVTFSPDGKMLLSGSDDRSVRLWDVSTGRLLKVFQGHSGWVRAVAFSPDGKTMASGCGDQRVCLWDVSNEQPLQVLQEHKSWVRAVAFSPDGKMLASGCGDRTIRIWDVGTGCLLKTLQEHSSGIRSLSFSPDGKVLASGNQDTIIHLWDMSDESIHRTLEGHSNGGVWSVAFNPDGSSLVSGGDDGTIRLWDMHTGQCSDILRSDYLYENMNITGVIGLTDAQRDVLIALGAIDEANTSENS